ncbi:MAG: ABC transporter ATP-binding protein [Gluconacetobacter diazotrophicus]|nr:ABC transporter ATP-binding protein [Gluconacetobacter diazotrophicus]
MTGRDGNASPILELREVSALAPRRRGGRLRGVDLTVGRGRCLALLGERGGEGSFLLDLVAGYEPVSAGAIAVNGLAVSTLPPGRRGMAMVSGRDPLFPHLSVRDNLRLPLRIRGAGPAERDRRVDEAMALLGLDGVAALKPRALDPADAVRARLARALVFDPQVLLMDDPFAGLDAPVREILRRTVRRLVAARGLCVLHATVDRDEALLLGDAVGVLHDGALQQSGPATELLDRPASAVVARVLGDANLLPGQVLRGDAEVVTVRLACGGEMEAEPAARLENGETCVLSVRPDRIATAFLSRRSPARGGQGRPDENGPEAGSLPAVLGEAVQMGDHVRLRFRLADGSEVLVRRPPAAQMGEMRPDRPAMLAWQPHQARAFPLTT